MDKGDGHKLETSKIGLSRLRQYAERRFAISIAEGKKAYIPTYVPIQPIESGIGLTVSIPGTSMKEHYTSTR
jgi:hypothetical protein